MSVVSTPQVDRNSPKSSLNKHSFSRDLEKLSCTNPLRDTSIESSRSKKELTSAAADVKNDFVKERVQFILDFDLSFIKNSSFRSSQACYDRIVNSDDPGSTTTGTQSAPLRDSRYIESLYEVPLLTKEQEQYLFRKYNYLKFYTERLRQKLDAKQPDLKLVETIEDQLTLVSQTRDKLITSNLRLVVSFAKKSVRLARANEGLNNDSSSNLYWDLVSNGNETLITAVDAFDFSKGNRFSTYASWALIRRFARDSEHRSKNRHAENKGHKINEALAKPGYGLDAARQARKYDYEQRLVQNALEQLQPDDAFVVTRYFNLDLDLEDMKLPAIGQVLGVSRERARQRMERGQKDFIKALSVQKDQLDFQVNNTEVLDTDVQLDTEKLTQTLIDNDVATAVIKQLYYMGPLSKGELLVFLSENHQRAKLASAIIELETDKVLTVSQSHPPIYKLSNTVLSYLDKTKLV